MCTLVGCKVVIANLIMAYLFVLVPVSRAYATNAILQCKTGNQYINNNNVHKYLYILDWSKADTVGKKADHNSMMMEAYHIVLAS